MVEIFDKEAPGAKRAELFWEVVKAGAKNSLLKIKLGTGRAHQIRAQFASIGHPILGDVKYGAPEPLANKSIALFSASLLFKTATGEKLETVELPRPKVWENYFHDKVIYSRLEVESILAEAKRMEKVAEENCDLILKELAANSWRGDIEHIRNDERNHQVIVDQIIKLLG
jgi:hypothetical protein